MDWDCFRYFLAVVEHKSLSAAARVLGVTQPTVGRYIRDLEIWLNARLFERDNFGYSLTPVGKTIVDLVREVSITVGDIERRVSGYDGRLSGRVRLSTSESLGNFWLMPHLASFGNQFPGIELEIILENNALDVMEGGCDLALRVGAPESDQAIGQRFGNVRYGLFANKSYLKSRGVPKKLEDLQDHLILAWTGASKDSSTAQLIEQLAAVCSISLRSNNMTALLRVARIGMGIVVLPIYMVNPASNLEHLLSDEVDHSEELWLLTHKDLTKSAKVRAVISFISELIRNESHNLTARNSQDRIGMHQTDYIEKVIT